MQSLHEIKLNIFGTCSLIRTNNIEVESRIKKDFQFFIVEDIPKTDFIFKAILGEIPYHRLPELKSSKQSFNSITYDKGPIRYNDYYKEALSIYDYKNELCEIFSKNVDRLHEITYLVILSRTGKLMDENGFHKVHACGVSKNGRSVITMLPMKGGNTTLFSNLIKDKDVEIISDDTPIVTSDGHIHSYPLRIGIEDMSKLPSSAQESAYTIDRKQYGKKYLIPTQALGNKINQKKNTSSILINGIRCSHNKCELVRIGSLRMFAHLCTHLVVGVGLPMIIEYFLRPSISDWILNFKIGVSRTRSAFKLAMNSENYICYMGEDPELNAEIIRKKFLK